jgi:ribosomal protein L37AE/L43A
VPQQTPLPRRSSPNLIVGSAHHEIVKGSPNVDGDVARASVRGRGRGGRPKGRGRGGKSSKRKREDEDDEDSDSSEVITPVTTVTKSGRSILKPTSFVPPPHSPPTATKRKRPFRQRNPENAVCKTCLRGSSPASNMIVFCDGCNSPYHRYCHKPPIDQAVVDEVDKEWHCRNCRVEVAAPARVPVIETETTGLVSVEGVTHEQVRGLIAQILARRGSNLRFRSNDTSRVCHQTCLSTF